MLTFLSGQLWYKAGSVTSTAQAFLCPFLHGFGILYYGLHGSQCLDIMSHLVSTLRDT